ncbi:MAG: hypothetical protein HYZ53_17205 [Planctomycetes bacterium]|nr:hypothetical protein [Planctomycetota bacterium]
MSTSEPGHLCACGYRLLPDLSGAFPERCPVCGAAVEAGGPRGSAGGAAVGAGAGTARRVRERALLTERPEYRSLPEWLHYWCSRPVFATLMLVLALAGAAIAWRVHAGALQASMIYEAHLDAMRLKLKGERAAAAGNPEEARPLFLKALSDLDRAEELERGAVHTQWGRDWLTRAASYPMLYGLPPETAVLRVALGAANEADLRAALGPERTAEVARLLAKKSDPTWILEVLGPRLAGLVARRADRLPAQGLIPFVAGRETECLGKLTADQILDTIPDRVEALDQLLRENQ